MKLFCQYEIELNCNIQNVDLLTACYICMTLLYLNIFSEKKEIFVCGEGSFGRLGNGEKNKNINYPFKIDFRNDLKLIQNYSLNVKKKFILFIFYFYFLFFILFIYLF